jgi:hypothetical protein
VVGQRRDEGRKEMVSFRGKTTWMQLRARETGNRQRNRGCRFLAEVSKMLAARSVPHVTVRGSLRDAQELECAVAQSGGPGLSSCVWVGSMLQAFGLDWQVTQKWRVIHTMQEMEQVSQDMPMKWWLGRSLILLGYPC